MPRRCVISCTMGSVIDDSVSRSSPPSVKVSPEKEQLSTDSVNTPKLSWLMKLVYRQNPTRSHARKD
jgi:hypothetical protein